MPAADNNHPAHQQRRNTAMTTWDFPAPEPISLEAKLPAGSITVRAEPVTTATVTLTSRSGRRGDDLIAATTVEFDAGTLTVQVPDRVRLLSSTPLDLVVQLPNASSCLLKAASADVRCSGELASLDARTASGDIFAELVTGQASINTASGDIELDEAGDTVRVNTASGDTSIGRAGGEVTVTSASGDLAIGIAAGSAKIRTASGDVKIDCITAGHGEATTVSGDVSIAVPAGIGVYLDLSAMTGDVRSDLEPADGDSDAALSLHCRSISGDVRIIRAVQPAAG
jgi:putative adhesin